MALIRLFGRSVVDTVRMTFPVMPKLIPGTRMFSIQKALPRLPVPALDKMLQKYLLTVKPIVSEEEYKDTEKAVAEFTQKPGPELHAKLEERAKAKLNWLEEWWLRTAYLNPRSPVVINSNPGLVFPLQSYTTKDDQLRHAAKVVSGVMDYKVMVDGQSLPVDQLGGKPLCMVQFYKILAGCRTPGLKSDTWQCYPPDEPNPPGHIVVAHNNHDTSHTYVGETKRTLGKPTAVKDHCNATWHSVSIDKTGFWPEESRLKRKIKEAIHIIRHSPSMNRDKGYQLPAIYCQFFRLDVYGKNRSLLNTDQIYEQLTSIVKQSQTVAPPVGLFTVEHRDKWGEVFKKLLKDKTNRASIEDIHRSIIVLCLDQSDADNNNEDTLSRAAAQMLHGGGSRANSGNRWFDKTLQFVVGADGATGLNYEHCSAEGPPIVSLMDHVIQYCDKGGSILPPAAVESNPRRLDFNISKDIMKDVEGAKINADTFIQDLAVKAITFDKFGKGLPKSLKLSPDAFIQVSVQLAYYRLHGHTCATYESASLRQFQHGRTETIRSCSMDTLAFSQAMQDKNVSIDKKAELFKKAIVSHRQYTTDAVGGQGVDRPLLGLKLLAVEGGMNLPNIFMDPGYSKSCHFKLSTSQVPSKTDAVMCFGPVVPNGYGYCYNPQEDKILFALTSFKSNPETDLAKMTECIQQSLIDNAELMQASTRSKL